MLDAPKVCLTAPRGARIVHGMALPDRVRRLLAVAIGIAAALTMFAILTIPSDEPVDVVCNIGSDLDQPAYERCIADLRARASPNAETIVLLTGNLKPVGCPAAVVEGQLIPDSSAGSAIMLGDLVWRIRWPVGYSGRRAGDEVEILDQTGQVVARTGTHVRLGGGEIEPGIWLACPGPVTL
jgi:hypothetical protein